MNLRKVAPKSINYPLMLYDENLSKISHGILHGRRGYNGIQNQPMCVQRSSYLPSVLPWRSNNKHRDTHTHARMHVLTNFLIYNIIRTSRYCSPARRSWLAPSAISNSPHVPTCRPHHWYLLLRTYRIKALTPAGISADVPNACVVCKYWRALGNKERLYLKSV